MSFVAHYNFSWDLLDFTAAAGYANSSSHQQQRARLCLLQKERLCSAHFFCKAVAGPRNPKIAVGFVHRKHSTRRYYSSTHCVCNVFPSFSPIRNSSDKVLFFPIRLAHWSRKSQIIQSLNRIHMLSTAAGVVLQYGVSGDNREKNSHE